MCDYSLELVASRAAKVGDRLVTTQFKHTITRGFAEVGKPDVAVCILPGTELAFEQGQFSTRRDRLSKAELARSSHNSKSWETSSAVKASS